METTEIQIRKVRNGFTVSFYNCGSSSMPRAEYVAENIESLKAVIEKIFSKKPIENDNGPF